jgi:uncharacterized protein
MAFSFYDATIGVASSILKTLSHILQQAEQRQDASTLLLSRLIADMYPLTDQVRIVAQFSENLAARLTGREAVVFEGDLATFSDCYERIKIAQKALDGADRDVVNTHADIIEATKMGPEASVEMSGAAYAHTIVLPNIYFHLATAYGILRKEGISLSKRDYYVGFFPQQS